MVVSQEVLSRALPRALTHIKARLSNPGLDPQREMAFYDFWPKQIAYLSSAFTSLRGGEFQLSKPLKIQIVERARALIADEEDWCRGELARDARGMGVCPLSDSAVKRCGLGAVIAAAHEITGGHRAAYDLAMRAMRPLYGTATLVKANDIRGHAAVLALFDEVIAAG
jgi:hypothetical protein